MKRALVLPMGLAVLAGLSACGSGESGAPTAPTGFVANQGGNPTPPRPGPRAPRPGPGEAAIGTISIITMTPSPGASLTVGQCGFGGVIRVCSDDWRGTFNVVVDRAVRWPVLTVRFYAGNVMCGYAADTIDMLPAGETVTFRPARISLTDEFGSFPRPCQLPATTTRLVAELWSDADYLTSVTQELATTYTFVTR